MNTLVEKFSPETPLFTALERWFPWFSLCVLVGLCALQTALGALPTRVYAHDYFIYLDGAWRLANGQIPNRDFYSDYGVLVWYPLRWGLALYGYSADSIGLARAFYTAAIGIWFFLLGRIMPRRALAIVPWLFLLIFVSAARPLGEYPTWISHSMFYDRVAYALVMLVVFEQLPISRFAPQTQGRVQFWRGISTGVALVCAPLLRVSFALPSLAVLAVGLILFGVHRRHLAGVLAGSMAALGLAIACLHFQPIVFLHEVIALGQQSGAIMGEAVRTLVNEFGVFLFILAAGLAVAMAGSMSRSLARKYILATVAIAACDLYCRATNTLNADLPLASFWCLSGAIFLLSFPDSAEAATLRRQRVMAMLVLCSLAVPIFAEDFASSVYAAYKTAAVRNQARLRIDSARLRSWDPQDWLGKDPNFVGRNGQQLILQTNDGIHLLRRLSRQEESVFCIAYANPFPFAMNRRPSHGGSLTLNGLSLRHPVPEDRVIGHPDLLMVEVPNDVERDSFQTILAMYPELLTKEFGLVGSSEYWTLYRRRD